MAPAIAKQRMWLTADRERLVGEGDPKAATLYAAVGDTIPASVPKSFGIVDGYLSKAKKKAGEKAEDKARAKGEDKKPTKGGLTVKRSSKRIGKVVAREAK